MQKVRTSLGLLGLLASLATACSTVTDPPPAPAQPAETPKVDSGVPGPPAPPAPRPDGQGCTAPEQCASKQCINGLCSSATCSDGQRNGAETGVDCGGSCKKCDGDPCGSPAECVSNSCYSGRCGAKPSKKCGVGTPVLCPDNEECQQDLDCQSDYCRNVFCGPPAPNAHSDGRRNAGETDVDCGGPSGKGCAGGKKCKVNDDCLSTCAPGGLCNNPSDTDGKKNNGETDVDCGGPTAKKCTVGKICRVASDCGLGYCPPSPTGSVCVAPSPTDGVKNGTETDTDCGGGPLTHGAETVPANPGCAPTQKCVADPDCASSVCAVNKICVEAPSCRQIHGGQTCGAGEFGQPGALHESCCKTLPVPGLTMEQGGVTKQVYLDKYEITAGRVREWVADIKRQFAGVPNVKAWVTARTLIDPILAAQIVPASIAYLPERHSGQPFTFPSCANHPNYPDCTIDLGLDGQIGPTSYYRNFSIGGSSGCYNGAGSFGHRTYWYDDATSLSFQEVPRPGMKDILDAKSMNCMTPIMFAAFCAWDGGYMQSQAAISTAYGPFQWPWGDTPTPQDEVAKITNFNSGTGGFNATRRPRYLWPLVDYATFANDFSPIIAAPGRFPGDVASAAVAGEAWMDLGGNMIEWSQVGGAWAGWTGSSFEGHVYPRSWSPTVYFLDKYGKGGSRCMRLQ